MPILDSGFWIAECLPNFGCINQSAQSPISIDISRLGYLLKAGQITNRQKAGALERISRIIEDKSVDRPGTP
jgi:hypothetical protein